ncbi:uncharacterized protein LOC135958721 [Calliphora vicina]|uniref:uncharacterized protein LOC135958721 n=1 Tax=Calliphora vicina TaxID=7373 RepID=UPI00325C2DF0
MESIANLFDDGLLDYDEAMEISEPAPSATLSPVSIEVPTTSPVTSTASSSTTNTSSSTTTTTITTSEPAAQPAAVIATSSVSAPNAAPTEVTGSNMNGRVNDPSRQCRLCRKYHPLRFCRVFLSMSFERRLRMVVLHRYCSKCLAHSHLGNACPSTSKCRNCQGDHNTLLHSDRKQNTSNHKRSRKNLKSCPPVSVSTGSDLPVRHVINFSPTLKVELHLSGKYIPVRAILDSCCNISYVCSSLIKQLGLPTSQMGNNRFCRLTIGSLYDRSQKICISARVTEMVGIRTPSETVPDNIKEHFAGLELADPSFNHSGRVALVLGPEVNPHIMKNRIYSNPGLPMAQYTIFGWVISGSSPF